MGKTINLIFYSLIHTICIDQLCMSTFFSDYDLRELNFMFMIMSLQCLFFEEK